MAKQKVNARSVAAPVAVKPRQVFVDLAHDLETIQQSLASRLYDAAMVARKEKATEEELKLLLDAAPRQRRSEFKTVVTAPDKYFVPSAPKNLGALARFLKARMVGGTVAQAKSVATQKTTMPELKEKLGKAPAAKGANEKAPEKQAPNGAPLHDLHDALERAVKEYAGNKIAVSVLQEMIEMYNDTLLPATAEQ